MLQNDYRQIYNRYTAPLELEVRVLRVLFVFLVFVLVSRVATIPWFPVEALRGCLTLSRGRWVLCLRYSACATRACMACVGHSILRQRAWVSKSQGIHTLLVRRLSPPPPHPPPPVSVGPFYRLQGRHSQGTQSGKAVVPTFYCLPFAGRVPWAVYKRYQLATPINNRVRCLGKAVAPPTFCWMPAVRKGRFLARLLIEKTNYYCISVWMHANEYVTQHYRFDITLTQLGILRSPHRVHKYTIFIYIHKGSMILSIPVFLF